MQEVWRDIPGYENLYQASNRGRIRSNKTILKQSLVRGYLAVCLCKEKKQKNYYVARLVALTFIPNPNNLPQVNHKDEDKTNNSVENLEWCSAAYNLNYGNHNKKMQQSLTNGKTSKPVSQYSLTNSLITTYPSTAEASRQTGISNGCINECLHHKRKTAGGYIWRFC